ILKGGDRGPAIKPGSPEESLIISAVNHGEVIKMPPKAKLKAQEIADLTAWVKMGAPWPSISAGQAVVRGPSQRKFSKEEKDFWAFQPPVAAPIPAVWNPRWPQSPLDHFVLAKLDERAIQPAPPTDKRTLIRRATFDLIGLPPTPAEVEAFLADYAPD